MNDQARSLRRKMETSSEPKEGKTIAIISGKGGVGKSNVALNFSLELMNQRKKVIIFDLDVGMGNINILLGLQPKYTIIDLFDKQLSIFDLIEQGPQELSYIAGGSGLSQFMQMDENKKEFFYQSYQEVVDRYDYIIFDMGAGVTADSLFFILAADECLVVTTGEPTSITDAYSMIKQVITNGGSMPIYTILNRAKSQEEVSALIRVKEVVKQFLKVDIHPLGVIPEDRYVMDAVIRQVPFTLLNEKSPATKSIKKLVSNYLQAPKKAQLTYQSSFLNRLKNLLRGRV